MPKVTFSGDPKAPGTDPATLTMHGVSFPLGQPVDVSDDIAAKLATHSHFTVVVDEAPKGYRAVHKGFGRYSIVFGDKDEEVQKDLTKADAEAFNALSGDDQASYVGGQP